MRGCIYNTVKYLLFLFNLLVFLTGCVVLGFSIYALVDGKTVSSLVHEGASVLGESDISIDIYTTAAVILISASSIVVLISFLGCCGAIKENRFLLFLYFASLLVMILATAVGATIATIQSVDVIKQPLTRSMTKYNPESQDKEALEITRAWDDVQREFSCCGVNNYTDWSNVNGTIYPSDGNFVPASCCTSNGTETVKMCQENPSKYSGSMDGCFSVFKKSLESSKFVIGAVTITAVGVMFVSLLLLFGFALCLMPNSAYQSV